MPPDDQLKIIKVPLGREIVIKRVNFPELNNLELNLLENPKLLKKDAPLIPVLPIKNIEPPRKGRKIIRNLRQKIEEKSKEKRSVLASAFASSGESDFQESDIDERPIISKGKSLHTTLNIKGRNRRYDDAEDDEDIPQTDQEDIPLDEEDEEEVEDDDEEEEYEEEDEEPEETPEEIEKREMSEYTRKIKILKKQFPERNIPEINEYTDLNTVKKIYNDEKWDIDIDQNHENYRLYLMITWFGMEAATTQWFNMNMEGLTKYHIQRMSRYDKLLIELGEKSHSRFGENLPVEIKLIGLILFETLLFYISKQAETKGGPSIANLLSLLNGGGINQATQQATQQGNNTSEDQTTRKSKIKGPSISAEEIRKMSGNYK
jgi:hypothetical protein